MSLTITATVMPDRSVRVLVTAFPAGRPYAERRVVHRGQFVLPPGHHSTRDAVALVGEYVARHGVEPPHHGPVSGAWLQLPLF